jgi:HK97 family phage portal protein
VSVLGRAIRATAKAVPFPGWGGGWWGGSGAGAWGGRFPMFQGMPGERDWGRVLGDGSKSSIVEACVLWICRNFPEAPPIVVDEGVDGIPQIVRGHELIKKLRRPNDFYSGTLMMYGLLTSVIVDGNGYILKRRNDSGRVAELWYVPHTMMEPRWLPDGERFIEWYDYVVMGRRYPVPIGDVFHLRYGLDPENTRKGRSPLRTLFRELGVDEEASRFTSAILHNLGVPGIVVAPDKDSKGTLDEPARESIKLKFKESFGGDKRGDPIVMSKPTSVVQFGFSPNDMDLGAIRDIPEERVTAVLGIPAAVVGFGTGLQTAKVGATMSELRDQSYENCIIPMQGLIGDELTLQMLPEFSTNSRDLDRHRVAFDLSKVRVLMEAQGKLADRWSTLARAGIAQRAEARAAVGLPVSEDDKVFIPAPGVQQMLPDGSTVTITPPAATPPAKPADPQLALPSGKQLDERDAALLEGMALLTRAVTAAMKSRPTDAGFDVVREGGALKGIRRISAGGN